MHYLCCVRPSALRELWRISKLIQMRPRPTWQRKLRSTFPCLKNVSSPCEWHFCYFYVSAIVNVSLLLWCNPLCCTVYNLSCHSSMANQNFQSLTKFKLTFFKNSWQWKFWFHIIIIIIRHAPCQCVAPLATNSLHSYLSKASSIASSKVRLCRDRSLFKVAIQEV